MKLTIQIVNYNSREMIKECLGSIGACLENAYDPEILIINNDTDEISGLLKNMNLSFEAKAIEVNENIGFGRAHNLGRKEARGEFLLLLNPDTKVTKEALAGMISILEVDKKVGIVGSVLVDFKGRMAEESFGSKKTPFSTIKNKFITSVHKIEKENIFEVDWVSGGAMLIRKELFDELGGFDENYFMYFEDVDLCLRAKKKGHKIMVNPRSRIFHWSGQSFRDNRSKKKYYYISQGYYFRKNFGNTKAFLMGFLQLPFYIKNVFYCRAKREK